MKVFLCGGGAGMQTRDAVKRLNAVIDHAKPCLYIPLAMEPEQYDNCFEWITGELNTVEIPHIEMVRSVEELAAKRMEDYSFLFLGGGNTFKLLKALKTSGTFERIQEYLKNGGVAFGGSAGAIVFGKDLAACGLDDANEVHLQETDGFDVLHGVSILCHFTNRTAEKDQQSKQYLLELSKHTKAVALPEEVTLLVKDDGVEAIGQGPYFYFENGRMIQRIV